MAFHNFCLKPKPLCKTPKMWIQVLSILVSILRYDPLSHESGLIDFLQILPKISYLCDFTHIILSTQRDEPPNFSAS